MSHQNVRILLFLFTLLTESAPIHPRVEIEIETTDWRAQPHGRGTFSIIVSCGLTLGLCVWSAIHPDVGEGKTTLQHARHKAGMAVTALLMPEITVSMAWTQWGQARALHRALVYEAWRKKVDQRQKREKRTGGGHAIGHLGAGTTGEKSFLADVLDCLGEQLGFGIDADAFPKEVAFFVVMGGFVRTSKGGRNTPVTADQFFHGFKEGTIDTAERIDARTENPKSVATSRPAKSKAAKNKGEMKPQTHNGRSPARVSVRDIKDKGKASVLAKLIICAQVGWLVLQLIGRRASGLPMALIELHVLIHILIAAIVYWFWWDKPLDICEPILLNFHVSQNMKSGWRERPPHFRSSGIRRYLDNLWLLPLPNITTIVLPPSEETPDAPAIDKITPSSGRDSLAAKSKKATRNRTGDSLLEDDDILLHLDTLFEVETVDTLPDVDRQLDRAMNDTPPDVGAPAEGENDLPAEGNRDPSQAEDIPETPEKDTKASKPLIDFGKLKRSKTPLGKGEETKIRTIVQENLFACIFYFAYAALHAAAWREYFSSRAERWIWRGACLVVGITPAILFCLLLLFKSIRRLPHDPKKLKDARKTLDRLLYIIYILGSLGLLVEAFVSLRRLPVQAYESVPWTAYIPHF